MTNLWYGLRRANVRIPYPARDVFVRTAEPAPAADVGVAATLRGVALLTPLDDAEIARLSRRARRLTYGGGEVVVRERDTGDSFYVIEQGSADVSIGVGGGSRQLRRLGAGDVFGEMSLLAGEPRAATVRAASDLVVLVVDREAFREVIAANPAILDPLSEIAARRQAERQEQLRAAAALRVSTTDTLHAQRLRERIKAFFGL
jgi:CRP-like cAMP-binding protein